MKTKALNKIRQMSTKALEEKIKKDKQELVEVKMKTAVGKEKNLHHASSLRHSIAITKTILAQKNKSTNNSKK